jgi:Fe-S-cluster-containing hydrogenase component 2
MNAVSMSNEVSILDPTKCIGCGVCVSTCPQDARSLKRKEEGEIPYVPNDMAEAMTRIAEEKGRI